MSTLTIVQTSNNSIELKDLSAGSVFRWRDEYYIMLWYPVSKSSIHNTENFDCLCLSGLNIYQSIPIDPQESILPVRKAELFVTN